MALSIKSAKTMSLLQRCICLVVAAVVLSSCAQKKSKQPVQQEDMADYFATADESNRKAPGSQATEASEPSAQASDTSEDGISPDVFAAGSDNAAAPSSTAPRFAPVLQATEYQMDAQGLPIKDVNGQPMIIVKTYDAELIKTRIYTLEQFGPNPYVQQAPMVTEDIKQAFALIVEDLESGNLEEAEEKLQIMIEEQPTLSGPAYNLAILKYQQKDLEKAAEYSKLALDRNYYNQDARNLAALIQREKGDFSASETLYKENLAVWGGYAPGYRNLGILYDLYMGKPEEGLPYYHQYNALQDEQDRLVLGWTMDIERRLTANHEALVREQQLQTQAAEQEVATAEALDAGMTEVSNSEDASDQAVESNQESGDLAEEEISSEVDAEADPLEVEDE